MGFITQLDIDGPRRLEIVQCLLVPAAFIQIPSEIVLRRHQESGLFQEIDPGKPPPNDPDGFRITTLITQHSPLLNQGLAFQMSVSCLSVHGNGAIDQLRRFAEAPLRDPQGRHEAEDLCSRQRILAAPLVVRFGAEQGFLGAPEIRGDPMGVAEVCPRERPLLFHQHLAVMSDVQPLGDLHGKPSQAHSPGRITEPSLAAPLQKKVAELEGVEAHLRPDPFRALLLRHRGQLLQQTRSGLDLSVNLLNPVASLAESGVERRPVFLL